MRRYWINKNRITISSSQVVGLGILLLLIGCQPAPPPPALPTIGVLTTLTPVEKAIAIGITLPAFPVESLTPSTTPTQTPTPTITPSFTDTSTPTLTPNWLAAGVKPNWTPQTQDFNGVAMVLVPAGCFMMGSGNGDNNEKPVHEVCFDQPFWIDLTEVTQAQFKQLAGKAANDSRFTGDYRPVENITWFEAQDYCAQRGTRLPTETEWEYAARGPEGLAYPWGNTFDANKAVYYGNSNKQTANVGSKPGGASWVGALDMSGNVREWTSSLYQGYPYQIGDGRETDTGIRVDVQRMARGGGWVNVEWGNVEGPLRAADRYWNSPSYWNNFIGFRCARSYP